MEGLLDDLNGRHPYDVRPHGLRALLTEILGMEPQRGKAPGSIAAAYAAALRAYVDLWLDQRKALEAKRTRHAKPSLPLDESQEGAISSVVASTPARITGRPATKDERSRAVQFQHLLEDIAHGHRILPAVLRDGYTFVVRPTDEFMHAQAKRWPGSPAPSTHIKQGDYATHREYVAALINERAAAIRDEPVTPAPVASGRLGAGFAPGVGGDGPEPTLTVPPLTGEEAARKAAQIVFAEMLISDWRRRIAKCESPSCKAPYFRLGKWNTDNKASLCPTCRRQRKKRLNQQRLEGNREDARRALFEFVAERFAKRIKGEWYKNARLKRDVTRALNSFLSRPPDNLRGPLRNLYPRGITEKWLTSSHDAKRGAAHREEIRDSNWQWVEAAAKRRQHAKS